MPSKIIFQNNAVLTDPLAIAKKLNSFNNHVLSLHYVQNSSFSLALSKKLS